MEQLSAYYSSDDSDDEHSNRVDVTASGPVQSVSRRVRKIIGLNAILPREIADRLTKSTVQSSAKWSADDSTDDSSDEGGPTSKPRSAVDSEGRSATVAVDNGLQRLLSDLRKVAPTSAGPIGIAEMTSPVSHKSALGSEPLAPATIHRNQPSGGLPPSTRVFRRASNAAPVIEIPTNPAVDACQVEPPADEAEELLDGHAPPIKGRKELERELRRGNFSSVDNHQQVYSLQQSISEYRPTDELISSVQEHHRSSITRIPVPALQTYAPKEGATVQSDLTSKQRSKHQIHSLVVSAAALQAKRIQEAGILNKGTVSRKDGKRKYGW
jgi:hypothetical protein